MKLDDFKVYVIGSNPLDPLASPYIIIAWKGRMPDGEQHGLYFKIPDENFEDFLKQLFEVTNPRETGSDTIGGSK